MMKKDDDSDEDKPSCKGEAKDDDLRNEAKAEPKPTSRPGDDAPLRIWLGGESGPGAELRFGVRVRRDAAEEADLLGHSAQFFHFSSFRFLFYQRPRAEAAPSCRIEWNKLTAKIRNSAIVCESFLAYSPR